MKNSITCAILTLALLVGSQTASAATPTQTASFTVLWQDNSGTNNDQEDGFRVYRCQGQGCVPTAVVGNVGQNVNKFVDTIQADPGATIYCYAVDAFNSVGSSAKSATVCAATPVILLPPGAPSGVTVSVTVILTIP